MVDRLVRNAYSRHRSCHAARYRPISASAARNYEQVVDVSATRNYRTTRTTLDLLEPSPLSVNGSVRASQSADVRNAGSPG